MKWQIISFESEKRIFELKSPLKYDILLPKILKKRYRLTKLNTAHKCGAVFDFGGTNEYDCIFVTGKDFQNFHDNLKSILVTLYDEAHDPGNDSPQDQWFRENMTELKGDKNELNETKAY